MIDSCLSQARRNKKSNRNRGSVARSVIINSVINTTTNVFILKNREAVSRE